MENCRWATYKEQNRNRRNTINGVSKPMIEWSEENSMICYGTMNSRLFKGWNDYDIVFKPIQNRGRKRNVE